MGAEAVLVEAGEAGSGAGSRALPRTGLARAAPLVDRARGVGATCLKAAGLAGHLGLVEERVAFDVAQADGEERRRALWR